MTSSWFRCQGALQAIFHDLQLLVQLVQQLQLQSTTITITSNTIYYYNNNCYYNCYSSSPTTSTTTIITTTTTADAAAAAAAATTTTTTTASNSTSITTTATTTTTTTTTTLTITSTTSGRYEPLSIVSVDLNLLSIVYGIEWSLLFFLCHSLVLNLRWNWKVCLGYINNDTKSQGLILTYRKTIC